MTLSETAPSANIEFVLENTVHCRRCHTTLVIRYGTYERNSPFDSNATIKIHCYYCKNHPCPQKTFSFPSFPLIPIIRHSWDTIMRCSELYIRGSTFAAIAKELNIKWPSARKLCSFVQTFIPWLKKEGSTLGWGPSPDKAPPHLWRHFTRDFSHCFYPERWPEQPPTQF
ncbi:hypothetical protein LZ24_00435 [Desulfobotulus alkaliphilus]|uniref:Uncharacterized protein n=1 Tax=Desulfobotulus alkaliphilus TaxID=622671 RepID=A0A562S6R7_9BACT|nr:hypothetical protein LZ24_00435 [Desulfobotulus alkaliphilus]